MSLTKQGAAHVAASKLTQTHLDAVADKYVAWIDGKASEVAAIDALMTAADLSKHPDRVLALADGLYAEMDDYSPSSGLPDYLQQASLVATYATVGHSHPGSGGGGGSLASATFPLTVPTYDGNPSVGHPDVLFVPGGFAGYEYWMAFTPFPTASRENPSIVASHDGVTWEAPTGLTNPIVPFASLPAGHDWFSDTDLVLSPDGTTLMLYFRSTESGVANYCHLATSTDGVTWTPFTTVITGVEESPAVVVEDDGTFTMFTCYDGLNIFKRTSADGTTWSAAQAQTTLPMLPAPYHPWHIDVVKVGTTYHALVQATSTTGAHNDPFRLYHWTSPDGRAWTGSTTPDVPLTGSRMDERGHYRSSLQPAASGKDGAFDLWLTMIDESGANHDAAVWRFGLIRDFDFSDGETWAFPEPGEVVAAVEDGERWVMANELATYSGTPLTGPITGWPAKGLRGATAVDGVVTAWAPVPSSWHWFVAEALILNAGTLTGDIFLACRQEMKGPGDTITVGTFGQAAHTPAAQNIPKWVTIHNPLRNIPGKAVKVSIERQYANALDTLNDTVWVLALRLRRVRG